MWTDLITASGLQVVADLAVDPARHERLHHRDQTERRPVRRPPARRPSSSRPCLDRRDRCGTTSFHRSVLAAAVDAAVAAGHPVVEFERGAGRPPRLNDQNTTLSSSAPSSSRSSRMSEVASTPSTPGRASAARAGRADRCGCPSRSGANRRPARRGRGGRRRRSSACRCHAVSAWWRGCARRGRPRRDRAPAHR